jgi:hypothetical protein
MSSVLNLNNEAGYFNLHGWHMATDPDFLQLINSYSSSAVWAAFNPNNNSTYVWGLLNSEWTDGWYLIGAIGNTGANDQHSIYEYGLQPGNLGAWAITNDAIPTPIPAAVWLLGSGLIGIFGLRRRVEMV